MKVYLDRNCPEFQTHITDLMDIESLISSAVEIKEPETVNGQEYTKCIRIDLMGMCSSLFFDRTHEVTDFDLYASMEKLINATDLINKQGIFIKVRILLLYPYCISALTRMQAEISNNRASISEPAYTRNFGILDEFNERTFWGASFNVTQQNVITQISELRELINKNEIWNRAKSKNQFSVQYTPTHININYIQINNIVLVEPYVYAKGQRFSRRCSIDTPIIVIEEEKKRHIFEDNFRYLWLNDVTIDELDATEIINGKRQILPPQNINYSNKSQSIRKVLMDSNHETEIKKLERKWISYVTHQLKNRYCDTDLFQNTPEKVFITCAWTTDENGISSPHRVAKEIRDIFFHCLKKETNIVEAQSGDFLAQKLYDSLNTAESAIILLTKDICFDEKYYSRPNVYIELGYLMKQLGKKHILLLAEEGVTIPSNVQDIPRQSFTENIYKIFPKILGWLSEIDMLNSNARKEAVSDFHEYLNSKLTNNQINQADFNCIKKILFSEQASE